MKHAEVKIAYLNGTIAEFVFVENHRDLNDYKDTLMAAASNKIKECFESPLFPEHVDHMLGKRDLGTSLLTVAHMRSRVHALQSGGVSILSNPIYQIEFAAHEKIARMRRALLSGEKILINRAGGYMWFSKTVMEIVRVYDRPAASGAPANMITPNAKYIVLENDWTLPSESKAYLDSRQLPYSVIYNLRDHSKSALLQILSEFKKAGGKTVFVYTTGLDTPQMYDYLSAIAKCGLSEVEYKFNGPISARAQECVDSFKDRLSITIT